MKLEKQLWVPKKLTTFGWLSMFTQIIWTVVCTQNIVLQHPGLSMIWYLNVKNVLQFQLMFAHNQIKFNPHSVMKKYTLIQFQRFSKALGLFLSHFEWNRLIAPLLNQSHIFFLTSFHFIQKTWVKAWKKINLREAYQIIWSFQWIPLNLACHLEKTLNEEKIALPLIVLHPWLSLIWLGREERHWGIISNPEFSSML